MQPIKELRELFTLPQGEKVLVGKLLSVSDNVVVDIRSYYIDDTSGDKVPTSRGIRLQIHQLLELEGIFNPTFINTVVDSVGSVMKM